MGNHIGTAEDGMGRVYDINPDRSRGERSGLRHRVTAATSPGGEPTRRLRMVTRVEFDGDDDCGSAWVTAFVTGDCGSLVLDPDTGRPAVVRFRARVAVTPLTDANTRPAALPGASARGTRGAVRVLPAPPIMEHTVSTVYADAADYAPFTLGSDTAVVGATDPELRDAMARYASVTALPGGVTVTAGPAYHERMRELLDLRTAPADGGADTPFLITGGE